MIKLKQHKKILVVIFTLSIGATFALLIYPFVPLLSYYTTSFFDIQNSLPSVTEYVEAKEEVVIEGNRLVIPKIGASMEIIRGNDEEYAWSKGTWINPSTSTPNRGSNTALSAHRFKYLPPSSKTFYLLDKLDVGDKIYVYWEGKKYTYRVKSSEIVSPYAVEVLEPTEGSIITLITCDPLFSTKNRLVVKAELVSTTSIK